MKMASSSSSSSKCGKYDVFLSFRGDTRRNLADYLARTLETHGFNVFLDENSLNRGEPITPALKQAIKDSRLAAIIFSKGYAESRWCLDELVEILVCKETMGQLVLPVFYDIDPTHVRHQTRDFEDAFQRHQERFPDKVQTWKDALNEAAELAGQDFGSTDGYEGRFVHQIVKEIARKLKTTCLTVASYPVGIDARVQDISKYVDDGGPDDVRIIGIWGMGGLGKTTVAKAIFNKYQDKFAGKSFVPDVSKKELVDLQNILLYDVLRLENIKVSKADEGTEDIKRRLGNLRVLVIVDDVDSVNQLKTLAIKRDSFGPGSRIIITTRDKHLLKIINADMRYDLPAMNEEEALELLSWHAFGMNCPMEGYFEDAREVVVYCQGLPLALAVLGYYLLERSTDEWKSALGSLKRSRPYPAIHENLMISYNGLTDDDVKAVFLDISCFFIGMKKDYVMKILDRYDHDTKIKIGELQDQCLVTVEEGNLMMHGLIRDTGREIVRAKSPNIPGKRCRLWDHKDVKRILTTRSGTEEIEGIALDLSERHKPSFSTDAFRGMQGLRLLKLKGVKFTGYCEHLSKELRWLCWTDFPMEIIPGDFNQTNLVDIDLSHSNIQVWENSDVSLEKLKFLNLGYCNDLIRLPDFSKIPNLERLILKGCKNLQAIPTLPANLEILDADECIALQEMPNFSKMSRMRELHLNHSPKLTEILGLHKSLNSMTRIHMEGCTNLTVEFRKKILQGWNSCGYGGIFLNGSCIPEWFKYVGDDKDDEVCFELPQRVGSNFKGLTLCCVYSANKQHEDCPLVISVRNKTKRTALLAHITYASVPTFCDYEDHYLWQGQLSNDVLRWHEGNQINIFVGPARPGDDSARVKKIAVDLVWDKFIKENMDDSHPSLYDLNPHQDWLSGDNDEARTSHDASDENPPSKILRSDSVGGGDDEARTSHDASDENPPSKILRSDSVGAGDDEARTSGGGGDDEARTSHDASDDNPPLKILRCDSVGGGGDDEARTRHDASDENPPSKILRSDSVGDGGDDEARTRHDASDENPPSKILRSDNVGDGGDDEAHTSHDASDENPPLIILRSDSVGGGGDDEARTSHDASDENPLSKILRSDSVGGGGDDEARIRQDASDENPPSKILRSDNVGNGGDDEARTSHDTCDENPPSKILRSDSVGDGGDDEAQTRHDASDENPPSKILKFDSVGGGGDDEARTRHDASNKNPHSKILRSDSVGGGGDDEARTRHEASDENPPSKILRCDTVGGGDDEARTRHDAFDENPPLKILRSDSVGDGGDDEARTSHDAFDKNQTPKRGFYSFFSKLLPSCGKKTR